MKKLFSFVLFSLATMLAAAQTFTPTSADAMTQGGVTVSFDKGSGNTAPTWYANGLRLYANNTITVSGSALTNIQLVFTKQGTKGYAALTASTGTLTAGGESTSADDLKTDLWTGSATSVVFTLGASGQRLVKQIIVNGDTTQIGGGGTTGGGTTGGGTTGGGTTGGGTTLDPNYQYAEPTTVGVPTTQKTAGAQEFVENNIKVNISQGAIYADYFNCYAGKAITFTATKPIKAIVVKGLIKKGFSATVSAGVIDYADASEEDTEGDPVLIVTDINNTSVILNCVKQIRFYSIEFYFVENPDVEIGGGDGEYSYDWEPTDPTTFNLTFDTLEVSDMTEYLGYKAVYLSLLSEDAELDMVAFADYDERTGIAVGTYPLNFSYEEGTVEASVGGDDYYDYESYLITNFQEIEGKWYYDPYYIVSGTLTVTSTGMTLNATSYFGSTITATYTFPAPTAIEQVSENDKAVKTVENSRLVIRRDGKRYNVLGARL